MRYRISYNTNKETKERGLIDDEDVALRWPASFSVDTFASLKTFYVERYAASQNVRYRRKIRSKNRYQAHTHNIVPGKYVANNKKGTPNGLGSFARIFYTVNVVVLIQVRTAGFLFVCVFNMYSTCSAATKMLQQYSICIFLEQKTALLNRLDIFLIIQKISDVPPEFGLIKI